MAYEAKLLCVSVVALTVTVSAAALAATDEVPANAPQTENGGDGKSYLPPWMQKQDGAGASRSNTAGPSGAGATEAAKPAASASASAPRQAADTQRRKARPQTQTRSEQTRTWPDGGRILHGVAGIFSGFAR